MTRGGTLGSGHRGPTGPSIFDGTSPSPAGPEFAVTGMGNFMRQGRAERRAASDSIRTRNAYGVQFRPYGMFDNCRIYGGLGGIR